MGQGGRNLATRRAVLPEDDVATTAAAWRSMASQQAALLMAAAEYLRRFNGTFDSILPLPISGRAVDAIWPKTHSVLIADCAITVADYLAAVVRKGESFILLAGEDPWPTRSRLARLPLFGRLWPMRKIAGRAGEPACDPGLVLESAWYGRYSFVILADGWKGPAAATLGAIMDMLQLRLHTHAKARRTVHLLWALPDAPPADTVDELIFLCRETNVKFVAVTDAPARWPAEAFEETRTV